MSTKEQAAVLAVILAIFIPVWWFGAKREQELVAGCGNPRLLQALPEVDSYKGNMTTTYTYLYECEEGHTIRTSTPIGERR